MTQTNKLNLIFFLTVIVYLGGSLLYAVLTAGMALSPYVDLAVSQLLVIAVSAVFVRREKMWPRRDLKKRGMAPWSLVCLIGITVLIMPLMAFLNLVSSLLFGNATESITEGLAGQPVLLNLLFLAILPSYVEEYVFRGVLFQGYRRQGFWKAVLVSALFFGLLHLNFNQFSYGFALGIVFALVAEASGSMYASILIHFMINLQTVMLLNELSGTVLEEAGTQVIALSAGTEQAYLFLIIAVIGIIAVATTALAVLLIRLLAKLNGRTDYMRWVLRGGERGVLKDRPKERIVDLWFVLAVLICVAFMVYQLF